MNTSQTSIPVEKDFLEGLLQRALGYRSVNVGEWQEQTLSGGLEVHTAIQRLRGAAVCDGQSRSWSLIVKVIRPDANTADPQGYRYWKREVQAYQSGFLNELPGRLAAPHCYAVAGQPDGSVCIWMEDIQDDLPHPWSIEQYTRVARILGQFNGAYLAGRPLPADAWVTHDWLRKYLESAVPMVEFVRQNPAHPIVKLIFPGITLPLTLALWDEHSHLLHILDLMPQTFCHQDAFGRNLFYHDDQVVAIDWGYSGIAPPGAELAALVGVAAGLAKFPDSQLKDLDQACFTAYLEGLRQAGWQSDPRQVRKAYILTVSLRYTLAATIGELLPGLMNEHVRQHWIEATGDSPEKAGETSPGIAAYYQSIFMEVIGSLGLVGICRSLLRALFYAVRLGLKRPSRAQTAG